jgi:hypothetical protein
LADRAGAESGLLAREHTVSRPPTPEHALAFFMPDDESWKAAVERLESAGHKPVPAYNPYWDTMGLTFEDPYGYRVVLIVLYGKDVKAAV